MPATPVNPIRVRWPGSTVIVAGTGPSLTPEVADACKRSGLLTIVINDAHRLMPWAGVLYACDEAWWTEHDGALGFAGERWSSHDTEKNGKLKCADRWGLSLVWGRRGNGFSTNPAHIHYGDNSGFQGINLALLWGATTVLLVGFNMQHVNKKEHFFGRHSHMLRNSNPRMFIKAFEIAARPDLMPKGVTIINCTPDTALQCFVQIPLDEALKASNA